MAATKKDFEAVAAAIRTVPLEGCTRQRVATILSDTFEKLNPRFDRLRFYKEAGLPEHCAQDHGTYDGWKAWVNPLDADPALFG